MNDPLENGSTPGRPPRPNARRRLAAALMNALAFLILHGAHAHFGACVHRHLLGQQHLAEFAQVGLAIGQDILP
ncbi:MAG: hypothetical protein ACLT98_10285 [Eggerthellaceae bacterium]